MNCESAMRDKIFLNGRVVCGLEASKLMRGVILANHYREEI